MPDNDFEIQRLLHEIKLRATKLSDLLRQEDRKGLTVFAETQDGQQTGWQVAVQPSNSSTPLSVKSDGTNLALWVQMKSPEPIVESVFSRPRVTADSDFGWTKIPQS